MSPSSGPAKNLHATGDRVTFCLQSRCWQLLSFRFQCWGFVMNQLPPSRFSKFLRSRAEKQRAPHRQTASNCAPPCWGLFPVVGERKTRVRSPLTSCASILDSVSASGTDTHPLNYSWSTFLAPWRQGAAFKPFPLLDSALLLGI